MQPLCRSRHCVALCSATPSAGILHLLKVCLLVLLYHLLLTTSLKKQLLHKCNRAQGRVLAAAAPGQAAALLVQGTRSLTAFCSSLAGMNVIIVSSGAVGVGCQRLGLEVRPSGLAQKQALAAVGQLHLMRYYDDFFSAVGLVSGAGNRWQGG